MLKLHILNSSGSLNRYSDHITNSFDRAARLAAKDLKLEKCDVVVRDLPEFAIPELKVGGFTTRDGYSVYMSLDSQKGVEVDELYRQLLHELHHAKRFQGKLYPQNLLDNFVTEGLACCYEEEITGVRPIYSEATINDKQIDLARKHYSYKDYDHNLWFYGGNTKKVPRWFGYTFGYELCKEYLTRNNTKASENVNIKARELIS